ncbi:MAG: DUF4129 domain-containing protein [Marmoricola sp.]
MPADRSTLGIAGAAVALMVVLVASTAGGLHAVRIGSSHESSTSSSDTTSSRDPGRGDDSGGGSASGRLSAPGASWLPYLDEFLLIGVCAAIALGLLSMVRISVLRRRRIVPRRSGAPGPSPDLERDETPEDLRVLIHHRLSAVEEGSPRNAIVAAWIELEDFARDHGFARNPADTPAEFVTRALATYRLDITALRRLADLYREARFSTHPLSEGHRDEARSCLHRLVGASVR